MWRPKRKTAERLCTDLPDSRSSPIRESAYLTFTLTSALVQQHCRRRRRRPSLSFTCARSTYSPGALNVAVVVASITSSMSPSLIETGSRRLPNLTWRVAAVDFPGHVTSAWGPPRRVHRAAARRPMRGAEIEVRRRPRAAPAGRRAAAASPSRRRAAAAGPRAQVGSLFGIVGVRLVLTPTASACSGWSTVAVQCLRDAERRTASLRDRPAANLHHRRRVALRGVLEKSTQYGGFSQNCTAVVWPFATSVHVSFLLPKSFGTTIANTP